MLAQQVINGLAVGAIYTLAALGFSLIMGYLNVLNIAVSEVLMGSAFLALALFAHGLAFWLALLCTLAVAALASIVIDLVGYRPFADADILMPLLSTIAFSVIIDSVVQNVWGTVPLQFPSPGVLGNVINLGALQISVIQIVVVLVSVLLVALLHRLIYRTQFGRMVRTIAENRLAARIVGIPVGRVTMLTFALSGLLAAAAGILFGLDFSVINAQMGLYVGLPAIAVMVVGGVDNVWGSVVTGPAIGIIQALVSGYLSASDAGYAIFGVFIFILLIRPQGLFGGSRLSARF